MKESKVISMAATLLILTSGSAVAGSKTVNLENVSTMKVYWDSPDSGGDIKIKVYDSGCGDKSIGSEYITKNNGAVFEFIPWGDDRTLTYSSKNFDCIDLNDGDRNDDITVTYEKSYQKYYPLVGWKTIPSKFRLEYAPGGTDNKDLIYIEKGNYRNAKISCVHDKDGVDGTDDKYIYPVVENGTIKLMISESKNSLC
ncbi:hypothetical protein [Vibrio navarrensis]|nr:hypothetical protein [Vibrio navarrensis]MBE3654581.1 hypothetical protein [Vibrio navarrensis]